MITLSPTMPKLPWHYHLAAVIHSARNQVFVLTVRAEEPSFVVHRMDPDGSCHGGSYHETRGEANAKLFERSKT